VFGPGVGECIVLHLTQNQWVIIDSCRGADSKRAAALEYLAELSVDVAKDVRLVVATHYHDDHIAGLGEVFEACKKAHFACSVALKCSDWKKLVGIYRSYLLPGGSGVDELTRVMDELQTRGKLREVIAPLFCVAGREIAEPIVNSPATIKCLSPSDGVVAVMQARMRDELLPRQRGRRLRVPQLDSNDGSVVLSVTVRGVAVLLGADLQERNRGGLGWQVILDNTPATALPHEVFKLAHHGGESGHHVDVWTRLLQANVWSAMTPYNRQKQPLPTPDDCKRICDLTQRAYITVPPGWGRFRHWDSAVQKTAQEATIRLGPETPGTGHIRLRRSTTSGSDWHLELFGRAMSLNPLAKAA
jgi:hypothetical protein